MAGFGGKLYIASELPNLSLDEMDPNNNGKIIFQLITVIAALMTAVAAVSLGSAKFCDCGLCGEVLAVSTILLLASASLYAFAGGLAGLGLTGPRVQMLLLYGALTANLTAAAMGFAVIRSVHALLVLASTAVVAATIIACCFIRPPWAR